MSNITVRNTRPAAVHLGPKYGVLQPGEEREIDKADFARCCGEGVCELDKAGHVIVDTPPVEDRPAKTPAKSADEQPPEPKTKQPAKQPAKAKAPAKTPAK